MTGRFVMGEDSGAHKVLDRLDFVSMSRRQCEGYRCVCTLHLVILGKISYVE